MRIPATPRVRSGDWVLQFINIIFLMLLFFMVNAVIVSPMPTGLSLPVAIHSDAASPPQNALFIAQDGQLSFAGRSLTSAEAVQLFKQRGDAQNMPRAIVADRRLSAVVLINLLSDLDRDGPPPPLYTLKETP
jgi:biopolymer transport protein ExbD